MKIIFFLLAIQIVSDKNMVNESVYINRQSQPKNNIKSFLMEPILNYNHFKNLYSDKWTSGVFNNKNRYYLPSYKGIFVQYNYPEFLSIVVFKQKYGTYEDNDEYIISIIQNDFIPQPILNFDININTSKNEILALFGKPNLVKDSFFIFHDNKNKVVFIEFKNDTVSYIQISQFNIDLNNGFPDFKKTGGGVFLSLTN